MTMTLKYYFFCSSTPNVVAMEHIVLVVVRQYVSAVMVAVFRIMSYIIYVDADFYTDGTSNDRTMMSKRHKVRDSWNVTAVVMNFTVIKHCRSSSSSPFAAPHLCLWKEKLGSCKAFVGRSDYNEVAHGK